MSRKYSSNAEDRALNRAGRGEYIMPSFAALIVQPDGTCELVPLQAADDFTFDRFKFAMGLERGDLLQEIDAITLSMITDVDMMCLVDEEGLIKQMEYNESASAFCGQSVVGPALFINRALFESFDAEHIADTISAALDEMENSDAIAEAQGHHDIIIP